MVHFIAGIAFSHKGDTDAAGSVAGLMQYVVGRDAALACLADEDVLGINGMRQ